MLLINELREKIAMPNEYLMKDRETFDNAIKEAYKGTDYFIIQDNTQADGTSIVGIAFHNNTERHYYTLEEIRITDKIRGV